MYLLYKFNDTDKPIGTAGTPEKALAVAKEYVKSMYPNRWYYDSYFVRGKHWIRVDAEEFIDMGNTIDFRLLEIKESWLEKCRKKIVSYIDRFKNAKVQ